MQKLILSMLVLLISVTSLVAQSGADELKKAKKAFATYKTNGDAEALSEAAASLEMVMKDNSLASDPKVLLEAGDIYKEAIIQYVKTRTLNPEAKARAIENPAVKSAKAYMKAYEMADKKGLKKAALKGLTDIQGNLTNEGIMLIQDGAANEANYGKSYVAFSTNMMVSDFLKANGGESTLSADAAVQDKYFAGLGALLSNQYDNAKPLFEELVAANYDESAIYDGLFRIYKEEGDNDKAAAVLTKGRELYPDDNGLLFNEINFLLGQGRLDELTGRLETAISKEPNNMSLYATLANVYQQLYTKTLKEGNEAKAQEYFAKAKAEYERGLEKEPTSARMIAGLGSMIYNRAAAMTEELVKLGDDFSKEGQKKYDALNAEINAEFAKALPFFQKAEMNDPSDINTLIALKEIYARMDKYEISDEFKQRIEKVSNKEAIPASYFKENGM